MTMNDTSFPSWTAAVPAHVSFDRVWFHLLEKVLHPDKYVPGVHTVSIESHIPATQDTIGTTVRRMHLPSPNTPPLLECITTDCQLHEITFTLQDHPFFKGAVINRLWRDERGIIQLQYENQWLKKNGEKTSEEEYKNREAMMRGAVEHMIKWVSEEKI